MKRVADTPVGFRLSDVIKPTGRHKTTKSSIQRHAFLCRRQIRLSHPCEGNAVQPDLPKIKAPFGQQVHAQTSRSAHLDQALARRTTSVKPQVPARMRSG